MEKAQIAPAGVDFSSFFGETKKLKQASEVFKNINRIPMGAFSTIIETFQAFDPLSMVLQAVSPILDIISGLFGVMAANVLPPLFQVLKPIMDVLLKLTPVFEILGKLIGGVLSVALIPLSIVFEIIGKVLEPVLPYIQWFADLLDIVGNVIQFIVNNPLKAFEIAIKGVWFVIAQVVNGILTVLDAIDFLNIFPALSYRVPLPTFDTGGRMLQDGLAKMQAGEIAITGNQLATVEELLEKQNKILTQQLNKPNAPLVGGKY